MSYAQRDTQSDLNIENHESSSSMRTWTYIWLFSMTPEGIQIEVQEGHANLTPKWSLCICVQIAACEVDGPSLHPSTWHLYTLLTPPTTGEGVPCGQEWPPPKLVQQLRRRPLMPIQPPSGFWGGGLEMVAVGVWCHCLDGDGMEDMGECDMAPLKSPYRPLPPILPLLIQSSTNPPFLAAEPPPSVHLPVLTNPDPEKQTNGVYHND